MTTISSSGGTTINIQQNINSIEYQINSTSGAWTPISVWPVTLINSTATTATTYLNVRLYTNITISTATGGTNGYFRMGSQYTIFDGNNLTVTIDGVTSYSGLLQNGNGSSIQSYSNITVQNIGLLVANSSSLASSCGWVCQIYFGSSVNTTNNIITNCYSTGDISGQFCGGVIGRFCAYNLGCTMTVSYCYSTGLINGNESGGVIGANFGRSLLSGCILNVSYCYSTGSINGSRCGGVIGPYWNGNILTASNCYSTGDINCERGGGICGVTTGYAANCTITNCYSTGNINASQSGGIVGLNAGFQSTSMNITKCYSLGNIVGTSAGGICGPNLGETATAAIVNGCYSLGNIVGSSSGGICGSNTQSIVQIINCYSFGTFTSVSLYVPGMVGTGSTTTNISNYYIANGIWLDANASGALTGTPISLYVSNPGTTWTSISTNTPYIFSGTGYNAQLYNPNSYTNPSGNYQTNAGLLIETTYSIISVNDAATPSSITVNSGTGVLTFISGRYPMNSTYNVKVLSFKGTLTPPKYYSYNVNSFTLTQVLCFKEGSKILYLNQETNSEEYIKIEDLRKGDLVKTLLHGYKPISNIGYSTMFNKVDDERTKDKLYICEQTEYPEVFEPLIISGCHSILVDCFIDETEYKSALELLDGKIYFTDGKTRLPACIDERAKIYEVEGKHTIYHFALEHHDYYMNYGIYANGLLVETASNRMMAEYGMTLF